jgi:two-component system, LytTR family, sensor histidine kinase AlgZ
LPDTPAIGGNGHGLQNVRQRVAYHFGPHATVHAEVADARFVVTLYLPEIEHDARPHR